MKGYPVNALHNFDKITIDKECDITGYHKNELFYNCVMNKVAGLTLDKCDLNHSRILVDSIRDALGFTLTLSCPSFRSVEYSPLLMDLMLFLLTTTSGNDDRREQIASILGEEKMKTLTRVLRGIE